ncbi:MAG: DUF2807 domain-containing protein [Treponema sp.]|jgi:hypothetical protein|nr:DUF2807 domain-containing protein [Treponema sp.]
MKKILVFLFCALIAVFCFSSCILINFSDFGSVKGEGDLEKFEFRVGDYNRIKMEGAYEVRYYSASSDIVTLNVQPNLKEYFKVEVTNGELIVSATKRIRFSNNKMPVLTVSTPLLTRLNIEGACDFKALDKITSDSLSVIMSGAGRMAAELDVNSLIVDMSGAGSMEFSGRADKTSIEISGAGEIDALSLQSREAKINLSGAATVKISISEFLRIDADGVGTVEYRGSPVVEQNTSGMVNIRRVN